MTQDPLGRRHAWSVLIISTFAFTICFMVWMMFAVLGVPLQKILGLNETQTMILAATPVLSVLPIAALGLPAVMTGTERPLFEALEGRAQFVKVADGALLPA